MQRTDVTKAERDAFCDVLQAIAWGKPYGSKRKRCIHPYSGDAARQLARAVLVHHGVTWAPSSTHEAKL